MLKQSQRWVECSALALAWLLAFVACSNAADNTSPIPTKITIDGMRCGACAKKVSKQLQSVPHVTSAKVDVKTSVASVTPQKDQILSPRLLWETVEAAGYQPKELSGPSGTFTTKPKG